MSGYEQYIRWIFHGKFHSEKAMKSAELALHYGDSCIESLHGLFVYEKPDISLIRHAARQAAHFAIEALNAEEEFQSSFEL